MKPWLRLTLITVTVGGGFTGVTITAQALLGGQGGSLANYVLIFGFLALFAFVTVSGLVFVHNPERTGLMAVALALQVPWVSSPIFAYKLDAGFQLTVAYIGSNLTAGFRLGSDFQVGIFQQHPWGAGLNLFALALLALLLRVQQMQGGALQHTAAAPAIAAAETAASSTGSPRRAQ